MRAFVRVVGVLLVLGLLGYGTLDVLDKVPGILTLDRPGPPPVPAGSPTPSYAALPVPLPLASATPPPVPSVDGLKAVLGPLLRKSALGPKVGVVIRDPETGTDLYTAGATTGHTPASLAKLVTAAALMHSLDPREVMTTRAVWDPQTKEVALVANGDMLLGPGKGDPAAVAGRAGLADLADATATALTTQGVRDVRLRLDLTYAAGPALLPGWSPAYVPAITRPIAMIGLSTDVVGPGGPASSHPQRLALERFATLLTQAGVTVRLEPESTWTSPLGSAAELASVASAPYADVLTYALAESDNALVENLVRQAMVRANSTLTGTDAPGAFVLAQVNALGLDTTGAVLVDGSGLSKGQDLPPRLLADVLARAAGSDDRALRQVVAGLPVAGVSGTLDHRFTDEGSRSVVGIPRAKTGTLTGVSGLAGTTVTADGRLLLFVLMADHVPASGTQAARAALDDIAAAVTLCGCR